MKILYKLFYMYIPYKPIFFSIFFFPQEPPLALFLSLSFFRFLLSFLFSLLGRMDVSVVYEKESDWGVLKRAEKRVEYPPQSRHFLSSLSSSDVPSSSPVEVKWIGENKGKGLFATRPIRKGEAIFREFPMASSQDSVNKLSACCCATCMKFLGSLSAQMMKLLDEASVALGEEPPMVDLPFLDRFLEVKRGKEKKGKGKEGVDDGEMLGCQNGCGEVYCSTFCRDLAWDVHHQLLCRGASLDPTHPLFRFEAFAVKNADHLRLAARLLAMECLSSSSPSPSSSSSCSSSCSPSPSPSPSSYDKEEHGLGEKVREYSTLVKKLWWEIHPYDPEPCEEHSEDENDDDYVGTQGENEEEQREYLHRIITRSTALLNNAFSFSLSSSSSSSSSYCGFSEERMGEVMGSIDMNSADLVVPSPLSSYFRFICTLEGGEWKEAVKTLRPTMDFLALAFREEEEEEEEEEGEEEGEEKEGEIPSGLQLDDLDDPNEDKMLELNWTFEFPHCSGAGMYCILSTLNHSCYPNAMLFKREEVDLDGSVVIFAREDIAVGEEITISYIDEHLCLRDRRDLLTHPYLFVCSCPKCEKEEEEGEGEEEEEEEEEE